jgi:tight adherence protein B
MVVTDWMLPTGAAVAVVACGGVLTFRMRSSARGVRGALSAVDHGLADAFIFIDERQLLRGAALIVLLLAGATVFLPLPLWSTVALTVACLGAPRIAISILKARRQARLLAQLPDTMQALASLLRAGHSLGQAVIALSETQPRPLRDEWRLLLRRVRLGETPDAVFQQLPSRITAPEASQFASTVRVALDLGGSLAESLENLSRATRRRLEMQERIAALTSQGRLQGLIVGCLPLMLLAVLTVIDGQAMSLLWSKPAGWAALALIVAFETCGFLLIRRIVRIDV